MGYLKQTKNPTGNFAATYALGLHLCVGLASCSGSGRWRPAVPSLHMFSLVKLPAGWRASRSSLSFVCVFNESMGYGD